MSWAALAHKVKDVTPSSSEPKKVVFAPLDHNAANNENDDENSFGIIHNNFSDNGDDGAPLIPSFRRGLLILDANAFIKGLDSALITHSDVLVTTASVIAEVRDRAARDKLNKMPHPLFVLNPSRAALKDVINIAERTGDMGSMSRTDIHICALALDGCRAAGVALTPVEPRPARINPGGTHGTEIITEPVDEEINNNNNKEKEEEEEEENDDDDVGDTLSSYEDDDNNNNNSSEKRSTKEKPKEGNNNNNNNDNDEEGWITPANIHQFTNGERVAAGECFDGGVACVTSDFAMQNTLLHLGVPIIGPRGMRVNELRHWLLRCTSCFSITTDTTRVFCKECGSGDTLRRVQYVVNKDGERHLFINFRKSISTRGTVYNLPKPRGGKRGTNRTLVLREDQMAHILRGTTTAKLKEKHIAQNNFNGGRDGNDDLAAFGEAPRQKKRDPNQPRVTSSYHKYNVNEMKKVRAARRK